MILAASEAGEGPPVALLHGLFGQGRNLGAVARALAETHRVISLDLRNHGASPHAPGMEYGALAEDVRETLASRHALPCALLGHSMGGKTAMALALAHPAAVTRLLVADIAPLAYTDHGNADVAGALRAVPLTPGLTRARLADALADTVPDPAVRQFLAQNLVPGTPPVWRLGLAEIAEAIADLEGWPEVAGAYAGPALFVRGGRSDYVPDSAWPAFRARFPAAALRTLPEAGHWVHMDAAFIAVARGFFFF